MSIFDLFRQTDINSGVNEYRADPGAVLLDVRTRQEFQSGHIRGSINIPLQDIGQVSRRIPDLSRPIYIYCLSGARAGQAASKLKAMGYSHVKNIGGISSYRGQKEK